MCEYAESNLADSGIFGWFHIKPVLCLLSGQTHRSFVEFILTSAVQLSPALFDAHHSPKSITIVSGADFFKMV